MARLLRTIAAFGVGALVATAPVGHAQQTPADQAQTPAQPPVFRAGINYVRVDVIVTDKDGNAVTNLKAEDFQILEQNVPQKVDSFKLIALDGGLMPGPDGPPRQIRTDLDEELEASKDDVRLFGIFLDDYHVRRETSMQARDQVARFVQTQLGPSDMVGLMYPLQASDSVRMTRNHDAIVGGLQRFLGRKYDYTPMNEAEQRLVFYPTQTVEEIRNQISMSAIKGFILHMGALKEGRKSLILVSEGYSGLLPPQLRDSMAVLPGSGNTQRGNPDAASNVAEQRQQFSAGADLESSLRDIFELANRYNVSIYAVDPRGLATNEFGIDVNINMRDDGQYLRQSIETLRTLALQTDGRAIVNRNDLTLGMKQIVKDSSWYYLLGYNSTFTATDGKYHEIKVNVKRPGVQVRARKGYIAFSAQDAARATAPPKPAMPLAYSNALASIAQTGRSRIMRTWIGTERGAGGKTRVTFVWEPVPVTPGDRSRAEEKPARVNVTAVAPSGAPYFRGRTPDAPAGAAAQGGSVSFEVDPGPMQLRLSVESSASEVLDTEVREIAIPDLGGTTTVFATPQVFRARTVRDFQQLKADPKATPTAVRDFSRTDRVFIRVPSYATGTTPVLAAKLLSRTGQPIGDLAVTPVAGRTDVADVDLTLSVLAVGEYLVEITATGAGEPAKEVVGFRIAG